MSQKEESKKCSTCGEVKPLFEFHKRGTHLRYSCKSCRASGESKKYYAKNAERIKADMRAYAETRKPEIAEYQKKYRSNNPDLKKKKREYDLAHKDELRAKARIWVEKNRAHVNAKSRENGKKYRVRLALHCRQRYARQKGAAGSHTVEEIMEIGAAQKWLCGSCFVDISSKYHVDHIMPIIKGGTNDGGNLQLLCRSCNVRKGSKYPWKFDMDMWVRRLQRGRHG